MQALILAAGESSRFWPLSDGNHKSLARIMGQSLISRTIESISAAGVRDIIIVQSPSAGLEKAITSPSGVSLKFVLQPEPRGMGDAVLSAKKHIKGNFFVANPYHFGAGKILKEILLRHKKTDARIILVGKKTDAPERYGVFKIKDGKAAGIVEKPEKGGEPSDIRAVGMYFLPEDFLEQLSLERDAHYSFEGALENALKASPAELIITEDWLPTLKYPWDLFPIEKNLMDGFFGGKKPGIPKTAHIDRTAKIEGSVRIGAGTRVLENAVIRGPCYIGENCIIGNNALLREYVDVGDNAIMGANTEVARSIIGEGTHIHSGYVGDSIISENCKIGAGVITANTRIDRNEIYSAVKGERVGTGLKSFGAVIGRNTSLGVGVKTMPGILIGRNCTIGPGTVVNENVESGTTYYSEFKGIMKKKKAPIDEVEKLRKSRT